VRPMLATPLAAGRSLPTGPEWAFEVKWDGVRALADTRGGTLRLLSRSEREITAAYPELAGLVDVQGALLDGEIVAMSQGRPSFGALAERMHVQDRARARRLAEHAPVSYVVFDVLALYGVDLLRLPLSERRETLERLTLPPRCILSPLYDDGAALWGATLRQGLEGVVAKHRASLYRPGERSPDWLKAAHRRTRTALVVGWRPETSGSGRIGAVLLAAPDETGRLRYLGRAGSGLTESFAAELRRRLAPLAVPGSPVAEDVPPVDARGTTWCEPQVVLDVAYLTRTPGGRLRHPVLRGIREDATPDAWEAP
jgi:bifunctional non-homologous end joining protein LigD